MNMPLKKGLLSNIPKAGTGATQTLLSAFERLTLYSPGLGSEVEFSSRSYDPHTLAHKNGLHFLAVENQILRLEYRTL